MSIWGGGAMTGVLLGEMAPEADGMGFSIAARAAGGPEHGSMLVCDDDGGLVTIAGTGAGKGVSHVIPAALTWPGSLVVIDIQGEIAAVTARRRREMGQAVVVIDPFNVTRFGEARQGLNPLDLVDAGHPDALDDCLMLAAMLTPSRITSDPFWDDRARDAIAGAIAYVAAHGRGEMRTLRSVRRIWTGGERILAKALAGMKASPLFDGHLDSVAEQYLSMPERTQASVLASINNALECLMSPAAAAALTRSTIAPAALTENQPTTIYLIMPPERLNSHSRLLRLWLGVILTAITRRRRRPPTATLILADEAAQLGRMDLLLQAASLMRGYGVRLWTFWQSLGQVEALYGREAATLIDNASALCAFGMANQSTADSVAAVTGWSGPLLGLPRDRLIVARRGCPPMLARRINYLEHPNFRGMYDANPYHDPAHVAGSRPACGATIRMRRARRSG